MPIYFTGGKTMMNRNRLCHTRTYINLQDSGICWDSDPPQQMYLRFFSGSGFIL